MTSSKSTSSGIPPGDEKCASRRPARRGTVVVLAVVAVLQAVAVAYVTAHSNGPAPFVKGGQDLSGLSLKDSRGALLELGAGHPTLLLVFDPDCVHSRRIVPLWTSWLEGRVDEGYRIIAISTGPGGADYVHEEQLPVVVTSAEPIGHVIAKRTPWVFAVDGRGRVVADGHGQHVSEIAQNLRSAGDG